MPRPVAWLFPAVVAPGGGALRGRVFKSDPDRGDSVLVRNLRSIVGARELPYAEVTVRAFGREAAVRADDEGFFSAAIDARGAPLALGRYEVLAFVGGGTTPAGRGAAEVVPDDAVSVVSDFDDTLAETHVSRRLRMLRTALASDERGHPAVPGMAALYRGLARRPRRAFHYLSGTPVGLFRRTVRFLERHGFPWGTVALRHLPSDPLDPLRFKLPRIEAIASALPGHRLVLVGDSGEKDPEVFAKARARLGDRVTAVLIRRLGAEPRGSPRFRGAFVFDRASEAAAEVLRLGLVDAASIDEVRLAEAAAGSRPGRGRAG